MNSEPRPSDREVLTGLIERVTYQNAENGFCVLRVKARGQRELVTLVGHAAAISAGEWVTATGNSARLIEKHGNWKKHGRIGRTRSVVGALARTRRPQPPTPLHGLARGRAQSAFR
jgi:hypothetical protein